MAQEHISLLPPQQLHTQETKYVTNCLFCSLSTAGLISVQQPLYAGPQAAPTSPALWMQCLGCWGAAGAGLAPGSLQGGSSGAAFQLPINMRIWQVPDTAVALLLLLWGRTSPNKPSRKRFDTWINAQRHQMLLPYSCTTPTSYRWCWCVFPGDIVIFDTPCWLGNAGRKYLTLLFPAGNKSANYKKAVCGPARVRFFPTTAIVYAPMG